MDQQATFLGNDGAAKRRVNRLNSDWIIAMGVIARGQKPFAGGRCHD